MNQERNNKDQGAAVLTAVPPFHEAPDPIQRRSFIGPLITIAIPTYNRAVLLEECIRSALAQTFPHFEVLVSDNASTDETPYVLRSIDDTRLRVITQERNIGLTPNWNACLTTARGDYVIFLSDDDRIAPDFLQKCVSLINLDPGLRIVIALSDLFLPALNRKIAAKPHSKLQTGVWPGNRILLEFFKLRIHTNVCTILFSTRELQARGGFPSEFTCAQDLAASLPLLLLGRAGFVNETCGFHSLHEASETSKLDFNVRFGDDQKVSDLIARTAEPSVSNLEERKLVALEAKRWVARNAINDIAGIRRRGVSLGTAIYEIWQRRQHFCALGPEDILRLARPFVIIILPQWVTVRVAGAKKAITAFATRFLERA